MKRMRAILADAGALAVAALPLGAIEKPGNLSPEVSAGLDRILATRLRKRNPVGVVAHRANHPPTVPSATGGG